MKDLTLDSADLTWLSGLARALLGEAHAAEDLVQETAVAALEGSPSRGVPQRAWLASVARRLAARRFRSELRRTRREGRVARPEALPDSAELVEKAEIAEQVTAAARRLPEPFRRTILLRFLEGRSPEEIAREEGKPVDTVRWRVRRGLELLREELVRRSDRDWSAWSALLLPLARSHGDVGLATAGASGVSSGTVVSLAAMKAKMAIAGLLACAGLWLVWDSLDGGSDGALVALEPPVAGLGQALPAPSRDPEPTPVELGSSRALVASADPVDESAAFEPQPLDLLGKVVDEAGEPVAEATVYLIPTTVDDEGEEQNGPLRARTESDWRGAFRLADEDWRSEAEEEPPRLDLGVVANGFLRTVVSDVLKARPREEVRVVLERGGTLSGRVLDELGRPVRDLELLAYSAYASVGHVSPSQRLLRAQRSVLAGASSDYDHCRATTDGRGEVRFTGLPAGELRVLPLDPGWTIEDPEQVEANGSYVQWTASQRLGVRLIVVERGTGQPVERAAATFRFEATFANGEVREFGQWVGRGAGEVSYVLEAEQMPGLEDRTITRAAFYGTVRSGDGDSVNWTADPIEDPGGAVGVVEVQVEADTRVAPPEDPADPPQPSRLALDVRYADATPFEGELRVTWSPKRDPRDRDRDVAEAVGIGRYAVDVTAGDLVLEVQDRSSSGSLPPWWGEVTCEPGRLARVFVTLPSGASATIPRPEGWRGEWFLAAYWRVPGEEQWRGSIGYSSAGKSMTLTVLRPAEWRFELRRDSALEADPIVRTVLLEEGQSVVVDE